MAIHVAEAPLRRIRTLRESYRREMDCQIVHDSWHARGFTRSCLISLDDEVIGYGSVGAPGGDPRDVVKEFFLHDAGRCDAETLFRRFVDVSGAKRIEAQTNDRLLSHMLFTMTDEQDHHTFLFRDDHTTHHGIDGATFRKIGPLERRRVFQHEVEPVGDWGIELAGEIVATGGLMFHYNPPYSDIYMEVAAPYRRRGIGACLVQHLKRLSYAAKKVPAARCAASNVASKRTLERAGMVQCGTIALGTLRSVVQDRDGARP